MNISAIVSLTAVVAITVVAFFSSGENPDQQAYVSEYCERVAMYEDDVLMQVDVSEIRGHRDFNNLCGG